MKLVWNGIVKNESAILERCVTSLLPHIDGAVILDTGSSDGTPELLERLFDQAGKPLELHHSQFLSFAHARNLALEAARSSSIDYQYLLLVDADMELVVEDPSWTKKLNGGPAYDVKQVAGSLVYWNRRLVNRAAGGLYECPTHEYLNVPTAGQLNGVWFRDYADGSSRPGKLQRDVELLEAALRTEIRPGLLERIHFYLAQTFLDLGNWEKAAEHYRIRVSLGGFDEERWYAQRQLAICCDKMGCARDFVWESLQAYNMRPHRAETLYDLSRYFRERGHNHTSLLFSEAGMQLPSARADSLFVNSWIHEQGLKEEFSICAYYDDRKRSRGVKECNKLALAGSEQARSNLYWYLRPLADDVSSFKPQRINFDCPPGYVPCNPSVINKDDQPLILVRTVNYTINADGGYDIRDGDGACSDRHPICTRNFLVYPQHPVEQRELRLPDNAPETQYPLVRGFEDSRLFNWCGELWTSSTVREWNPEGWCEQVRARVDEGENHNWKRMLPAVRLHEKNWMPWVRDTELRFVYRLGTLVNSSGEVIFHCAPEFDASYISGGSQVVQVDERTWLALVHEARTIPARPNRYYQHRFVSFHPSGRVDRISPPFFFHDRQIEFAAGLAVFGKQLMVSYGVRDAEAWTAVMDTEEVLRFLYKDAL